MPQKVTLGYAEPLDDDFNEELFPSKIGGKPRWLDPTCPLSADKVICDECNKPMVMLLQLYAPEDEPAAAFHRTLYVFICRNGRCHKAAAKRCMRVFRSQLPEHNRVYIEKNVESTTSNTMSGSEESDDDDIAWEVSRDLKPASLCVVCGLLGSKACSKCHSRYYCSRDHQVLDWESGHRKRCNADVNGKIEGPEHDRYLRRTTFPEHLIVSEEEGEAGGDAVDNNSVEESDDDAEDDEGIKPTDNALVLVSNESVEDSSVDVDRAFLLFQNRTAKSPDQVLRHARTPDSSQAGEPLYVSDADKPELGVDVPRCRFCGAQREFEFQIMPQMLNYLSVDSADPSSIDWGTLLVYTCPSNCSKSLEQKADRSDAYLPEIIYRQNFSSQGIGEKYVRAMHGDDSGFEKQFESLNI
ncbi:hypothetical protein LPJ59_002718 [Coemansia sp. RSA 2399]|nr:hypothetical protein LPJ59_002718 [Coemansia sp. RSA 2399]KAJ1904678.1 hypothetical protein LPJ81_002353 [Coemansia sp. IMI 209127]